MHLYLLWPKFPPANGTGVLPAVHWNHCACERERGICVRFEYMMSVVSSSAFPTQSQKCQSLLCFNSSDFIVCCSEHYCSPDRRHALILCFLRLLFDANRSWLLIKQLKRPRTFTCTSIEYYMVFISIWLVPAQTIVHE